MQEALRMAARELELNDISDEALRAVIERRINELLSKDPHLLTSFLYRLDVDEKKIAQAMENPEGRETAAIIADLIIERQAERIRSRNTEYGFRSDPEIPEDDKW